jgi:hypothetical protein
MPVKATTTTDYLKDVPEERKAAILKLENILNKYLPKGFTQSMQYGMMSWVVPHSVYPAGYHCNPKQALPFISIASQKNYIAVHHMGIYAMPSLLQWYTEEYPKHSRKKLDMGKGCLRFKDMDDIPYKLIEELAKKVSLKDWISTYEKNLVR